ncbi:MAG: hypothetical protein JNM56_35690 [Planctomycetia bacterium]|nr:hypothetical protein [Planctomycetia bacterium]
MPKRATTVLLVLASWTGFGAQHAQAQADRFQRFEPGLIVETGARMGACDAVAFTPDGNFLMAVGDDKVVRVWRCTERGLDAASLQVLRWSIFREKRGNIYALALSPDDRHVAVGGFGVRGAHTPALLDRVTGDVKKALVDLQPTPYAVWALAFSPSGKRVAFGKGDGQIGVWELNAESPKDLIRLGKHQRKDGKPDNKVRLVTFIDENHLLSVAEDGLLLEWDVTRPNVPPQQRCDFGMQHLWQARRSTNGQTIGVVSQLDANKAAVYTVASRTQKPVSLPAGAMPHSVAVDAQGERLAVACWHGTQFSAEQRVSRSAEARLHIFDLSANPPRASEGPHQNYYMDAIAFHPTRRRQLAIGGGADHEVTLWDLDRPAAPLSKIVSPGNCLWGVALSDDPGSRYLGFRTQFNVNYLAAQPNSRAQGDWRVFDLEKRNWAPRGTNFKPVLPRDNPPPGWQLITSTGDAYRWDVVGPDGRRHRLPLDPNKDAIPRCYTFLPGTPPRLAVGHFWGVSVFELHKDGPRRSRLMMGHQGEVMAVAPSADGKLLVTASRDQTIAAWSLAPWPSQGELGARFLVQQGKVMVDEVDLGSPAWEAGLQKGDEVAVLVAGIDDEMFDPGKIEPAAARGRIKQLTADQCAERLRNPVPDKELFFKLRRAGKTQLTATLTTVRQRPLWRFFPTRSGEWVLWRWRDYYYDCSTNGDSLIGWQISGDIQDTPAYYRAEQFRKQFHRPDKVAEMLAGLAKPEKIALPDIEPPVVRLQANRNDLKDQDSLELTLSVESHGQQANHQLDRVLLWINDFLFETYPAQGFKFQRKVTIPKDRLRRGDNLLLLQCYNKAEMRGEAPGVLVTLARPVEKPRLFGVLAGIGDYSTSKFKMSDLNADRDAEALLEAWTGQQDKHFASVRIELLTNNQATPLAVLKILEGISREAKPDDQLVLFLGGHGTNDEELNKLVKAIRDAKKGKLPAVNPLPPQSFAFVGPGFDPLRPNDTCLTSGDLYRAITRLPCHKLVLLDTCHSGSVRSREFGTVESAVNPVRDLTRDGVGPVIVAACQPHEQAIEFGMLDRNRSYGLFTMAVRRALGEEFTEADADADGVLEARELTGYIKDSVPKLVQKLKEAKVDGLRPDDSQLPTEFLPRLEQRRPLARK